VRAVQVSHGDGESGSESEISGSEDEQHQTKVYLAAAADQMKQEVQRSKTWNNDRAHKRTHAEDGRREEDRPPPCSHCGSAKHSDLGCWKRLTCGECGRHGHPADHCLYVCRACGKIHDAGKCPMEEFYNLVQPDATCRNAAIQRGEDVKLGRSPVWKLVRSSVLSSAYLHTLRSS
jgi:hypothetical protein